METLTGKSTPLHEASWSGPLSAVEALIRAGAVVNARDDFNLTPLHMAAREFDVGIIRALIQAGSDVNAKDFVDWTPLHMASYKGHDNVVQELLKAGSDPLTRDNEGCTPLHLAAHGGHIYATKLLLEAGSDTSAKDNMGKTPLEVASETTRDLILAVIKIRDLEENWRIRNDLRGLGFETVNDFLDVMRQGKYKCYWKRVYLVGPYGVGKSTLAKVLVGEDVPVNCESTDGIWIYMGRAGMDVEGTEWKYFPKDSAIFEILTNMLVSVYVKTPEIPSKIKTENEESKEVLKDETHIKERNASINKLALVHSDKLENPVKVKKTVTTIGEDKSRTKGSNPVESKIDPSTGVQTSSSNSETKTFKNIKPNIHMKYDEPILYKAFKHVGTTPNKVHNIPQTVQIENTNTELQAEEEAVNKQNSILHERIHKQVIQAVKDGQYKQKIVPIDIWDFGGQKDYYMTHQLFITSRGVFVLMFNGSVDILKHRPDLSFLPGHFEQSSIAVYLLHWVNSILSYCKLSDGKFPRIIFVATHKDKIPQNKKERQREILVEALTKVFSSHPGITHLEFHRLIFINARDKHDKEIKELQKLIMDMACQHPRWGEEMPTKWVPLELQLVREAELGKNVISKQSLYELNATNRTMTLTKDQIETFLKVQHSLGKLLYFDHVNLCDFIIINPAYLVEVLRSIITEKQFWVKKKQVVDIFTKMQQHGMITREDIYKLWDQAEFRQILSTKEFMIDMLVHLDILVKPYSGNLLPSSANSSDIFIVPSIINRPNHTNYLRKFCTTERSIIMAFTFVEEVIPPAMVFRFLGSFINMWKIKIYKGQRMLYSDLAVVEIDEDHDIVVQIQKNRLVVSLVHMKKKDNIVPTLASSVQECFTAAINRITEFYVILSGDKESSSISSESDWQLSQRHALETKGTSLETTSYNDLSNNKKPFTIDFGIYCNRYFQKSAACFFSHLKLSTSQQWKCPYHKITHNIEYLAVWFAEKCAADLCPDTCQGLGEMELCLCPSDKHLRRFVNRLTPEMCYTIFLTLGMETNVWEQLQHEYQNMRTDDFMFMTILRWKEKSQNASFRHLQDTIKKCDANIHLLCEVFRDIDVDVTGYDKETLTKTPSDQSLLALSNHIGNSCIHLGIELGIAMPKIQEIQYQFRNKLLDQTKEIFRLWKRQTNPKPTVRVLLKAVQRIDKSNCLREVCFT